MFIFPLNYKILIAGISNNIPPIVSSLSASLVPPSMSFGTQQQAPLSALTLKQLRMNIHELLLEVGEEVVETNTALDVVRDLITSSGRVLVQQLVQLHEELDDTVLIGPRNCKDWANDIMEKVTR